ncbi:MAG TPA: RluA family pseudouridine synthase [Abditibacteriaceae bacterium]|jgi:23S rRNA pseudouridine1911/1915/1917 synthase
MQHDFLVEEPEAGQRLDVFVAARLGVSRGRAQKLLEDATVNDKPAKSSQTLRAGDRVLVSEAEPQTQHSALSTGHSPLPPVLYEDEYLIVLNKPRGLVVHAGAGEPQVTLVDVLLAHGRTLSQVGPPERAGIVHRLDKDTSGIMMVCKTDAAHWKLAKDFEERRVRKDYTTLVCGVPPERGRIEAPIFRHPSNRKKMAVVSTGRRAVTEYSVVRKWLKFALLNVDLLTGRTHQIRVHLAYVHHPVVGDEVYGGLHRALSSAPNDEARAAIQGLSGQALHAARLGFVHPVTGEDLHFEAPLPDDMQHVLESLGEAI